MEPSQTVPLTELAQQRIQGNTPIQAYSIGHPYHANVSAHQPAFAGYTDYCSTSAWPRTPDNPAGSLRQQGIVDTAQVTEPVTNGLKTIVEDENCPAPTPAAADIPILDEKGEEIYGSADGRATIITKNVVPAVVARELVQ
jgi:hypothetical protein